MLLACILITLLIFPLSYGVHDDEMLEGSRNTQRALLSQMMGPGEGSPS